MALDRQISEIFPLTPLQRGLLFHSLSEPGADPYVVQVTARIDGRLDKAQFAEAWRRLADHHAALRSGFVAKGQREPVQVTFESLRVPVQHLDWRTLEPEEVSAAQTRLLREDRARGFPVNRPPLLRLAVARIEDRAWWVLFSHHHLILDGWSQPILFADLFAILEGTGNGRTLVLPHTAAFSEYVAWLEAQDRTTTTAFWRGRLSSWEFAPLPTSPRAVLETDLAIERVLDARTSQAVEGLARAVRVTPNTVFQAAWALVLQRYLGRRDVIFGVTVSGRTAPLPGIERMVGMLINTLPLRFDIPERSSVRAWLRSVQAEFRAVEGHAHADLAELGAIAGATPERPLFETLLAYENFPVAFDAGSSSTGLRISQARSHERTNLAVALVIVPGAVTSIRLQVNAARLAPSAAGEMADLLVSTLARMIENPDDTLACIDGLATPVARNRRPQRTDSAETLVTRFRRVAAAHPDRIALSGPGGDFTYRALDEASDRVAAGLRLNGVVTESRVGLCFERNSLAVVGMLGTLKAGAAYVPVDPLYPDERIAFTFGDSGVTLVLTTQTLSGRLDALALRTLAIETLVAEDVALAPAIDAMADRATAAYVIYTSGSTGKPKGVVITHANVLGLFDGAASLFDFVPADVWSVFHSFAFDFSVWEMWGALLHGARAVIVSQDVSRDPASFRAVLARERVTVLSQTPSAFTQLVAADAADPSPILALREVILGGEAVKPAALGPWFVRHGTEAPRLVNMYGITETTVHVTFRPLCGEDAASEDSPIGSAMPQLDVLLLDDCGRPVPAGVAGEIFVAGDGLARGYLGRPALTAERFVPHPWPLVPGERLYRSGDLARRLPAGELDYLARIDRQVKIRGFRIELGEVEAALRAHPLVAQAVASPYAKDADDVGLCGFVVETNSSALGENAPDVLRAHVATRLPAYMVPDAFVLLPALPVTLNGKIDLTALPDPVKARQRTSGDEPPESAAERVIAKAWAHVLGLARVGVTENYFALGGDSIRSIRIISQAADAGVRFTVRQLFENPTVRQLARVAQESAVGADIAREKSAPFRLLEEGERALVPAASVDAYPLARMQAGMLFHADSGEEHGLYLDLQTFRLSMPIDEAALRAAVEQTVAAHPPLRTGFLLGEGRRSLQFIVPRAEMPLEWVDLRDRPPAERKELLTAYLAVQRGRSYDLEHPPLARIAVHRLDETLVQLTLSFHHAILDGWSVALWESELLERYFALRAGLPLPQTPAGPPYSAFVEAERAAVDDPGTRAFWQARLASAPPPALPRWPGQHAAAPSAPSSFSPDVARGLSAQANASGLPLKSILLGIVGHVVGCAAGTRAMPVGLVTNGRLEAEGGDRTLGLYLNTLPVILPARGTRRALAQAAAKEEASILGARRFPLQELVHMNGGTAAFMCNFNLVHFHGFEDLGDRFPVRVMAGASVEAVDIPFSFNFSVDPNGGGLTFQLLTTEGVSTAQRDWLIGAVERGVQAAAISLDGEAEVFDGETLAELTVTPNSTEAELDPTPVHVRALAALVQRGDVPALRDAAGRIWTGAALADLADDLGWRLGARVQRGTAVLLWLPRSPVLVAAMLAVLRAGGAYVPMDMAAPAERVADILGELSAIGSAPLVMCHEAVLERVPVGWRELVVLVDSASPLASAAIAVVPVDVDVDDAAYIIFTSGSTGRPKGVIISHGALANHMGWMSLRFPLGADDVVLQRTSPAFDAAVWEFWAPLLSGAVLALAPDAASKDPEELLRAVAESGATILQVVPSLLDAVLAVPRRRDLRLKRLFCGGEPLSGDLAADALKRLAPELINLYGPTEATIDATYHRADEGGGSVVPIGGPVANMRAYVLDQELEPVPFGAPGELCLAGSGLARGYVGQPGLTAERFIPDRFATDGGRLYRTGDIVRRMPDGTLNFVGRADRQIKLGGNRLELEEVEAVIGRHPETRRVAVQAQQNGGLPRLLAYLEGAPDADLVTNLQTWLTQRLPSYAVPRQFAFVADWPQLPSGKTNAALLSERARTVPSNGTAHRAELRDTREQAMAALWEAILVRPGIGALDDFFSLGGDSILALQLAARARRAGFAVSPGDLFRYRTVRALCNAAISAAPLRDVPPPTTEPVSITPLQQWFFGLDLAQPNHWNQAVLLRCPKGLEVDGLSARFDALARRHDALRLRFQHGDDGWTMQAVAVAVAIDAVEVADEPAVTAACREAQCSLDLKAGPLFRVRLLRHRTDLEDRLLLVSHHLVVDGVSWRILLEELAAPPADQADGETAPYPFTRWAAAHNARQPDAAETAFWRDEASRSLATVPVLRFGPALEGQTRSLSRILDRPVTGLLLRDAGERLRADIPELILAALGQGLARLLGERETGVLVERHGRDTIPDLDMSRTVGWFTNMHPVRLRSCKAPAAAVRAAKEALRRVPSGGAGYLYLVARGSGAAPPWPQVSLNYLGQFDASLSGQLSPATEDSGPVSDPANRRTTLLDIVALVQDGSLCLSASFDACFLAEDRASSLLDDMVAALVGLAAMPPAEALSAWDVRDVPGCGLTAAALDQLVAQVPGLVAIYPAGAVARGLLFQDRMAAFGSGVYVQQVIAQITGTLDSERLRFAWNEVTARHEALRSSFFELDQAQLQVVHAEVDPALSVLDWSEMDPRMQGARWESLVAEERARRLDPGHAPLSRVMLVDLGGNRWRLLWTHHHLIMDGWSLPIVFADLLAAYGAPGTLPPGPTLAPVVRCRLDADRDALLEQAATDLLGLDQPSLIANGTRGAAAAATTRQLNLPPDVVQGLVRLIRSAGVSMASAVNAGFAFVLARHLGLVDVVHGVTVSGRSADVPGIDQMVGLFIATLPLRTTLRGDQPVVDLLRQTQACLGVLNERASLPLGELQAKVGISPLFDTIVVFENYPMDADRLAGDGTLRFDSLAAVEQNHYPLSLYVHPGDENLRLSLHFDPSLVPTERAERFLAALGEVLARWAREGVRRVGSTRPLADGAQRILLAQAAGEMRAVTDSVDDRVAAQARTFPQATALLVDGRQSTYSEILNRADRIAAALRRRGIGPEDRVAVMLPRQADLPVALLGVMRAGAAFVPLDPDFPGPRLAVILEDAAPKMLLSTDGRATDFVPPSVPAVTLSALLAEGEAQGRQAYVPPEVPLDALAYVIFTSGSTGRPKGVEISRRAFANTCTALSRRPGLSRADVVVALTTVSFDIALNELLLPWTVGAAIAILERPEATDGVRLAERLAELGATVLQATPATWRLLSAARWSGAGRLRSWCGGEALPADLATDIVARSLEAWNLYGPTETTIWSSVGRLSASGPVDAGGPIDNTRLYVVDEDGQLLPPGVAGHLMIGGAGVARGYSGKPGATAASFVPDPFADTPGAIAYTTGDRARWSSEGRLEILGRVDRQIKIGGYRIEPAEVEVVLRSAPGVHDAACAVRQISGGPALIAFLAADGPLQTEAVRRYVQGNLPAYMVPSRFVLLPALPLTPNGKVDHQALPDPGGSLRSGRAPMAPRDPVEHALLLVWQEAFERTDFGVNDDFFDLGGHSLLATQIHAKLGRVFQGHVPLRDLFDAPTIELLAERLRSQELEPGTVGRAAALFVKLRLMSAEERQALRDRSRKAGERVGA